MRLGLEQDPYAKELSQNIPNHESCHVNHLCAIRGKKDGWYSIQSRLAWVQILAYLYLHVVAFKYTLYLYLYFFRIPKCQIFVFVIEIIVKRKYL